jgi:hypothetical protein
MDFSKAKSIFIPEGEVAKISIGNQILWQKQTKPYKTELTYIQCNGTQYIDTKVAENSYTNKK